MKANEAHNPNCFICSMKLPFEMPQVIVDACKDGKLVIFAGAGISTENKTVMPYTLYEEIKHELGLKDNINISFSQLMSNFVKTPDGRKKLLIKIKKRLDYINSFSDLHSAATRFHQELATIPLIKDIITTNWDDYFEEECGAIPLVYSQDFAFWDFPDRKVFKIHGSISNYGSIVGTKEDYTQQYKKLSNQLIGNYMRFLLATKTVVFFGYSFTDEDFQKIYTYLKKELKEIIPHVYVVTTSGKEPQKTLFSNVTVIKTDGAFFLSVLKHKLVKENILLDDVHYEKAYESLKNVSQAHEMVLHKLKLKNNPELIYTLSYQEGLMHSLKRILVMRKTGEYSYIHYLLHVIDSYDPEKEGNKKKGYYDLSYITGYFNGLIFFFEKKFKHVPLYYLYGCNEDIYTFSKLKQILPTAKTFHKKSYDWAKKRVSTMTDDVTPYHPPYL